MAWDAARAADQTRRTSSRWPPRPRRRSRWTPPWTTPRTASRCSAGSASPGSTTRTCTCAGRWRCASCSAAAPAWRVRTARLALAGARRRVTRSSAAPSSGDHAAHRRRAGRGGRRVGRRGGGRRAAAGPPATRWPRPGTWPRSGRRRTGSAPPRRDVLVIDEELARAGLEPARPGDRRLGRCRRSCGTASAEQRDRFARAHAARRDHLVPAVQRAGGRLGPGRAARPGPSGCRAARTARAGG